LSIIDAREPGLPAAIDADICIVGAGAAGITLATQLLPAGRDVCLVESGGFAPDAATQSLYDLESAGYPQRLDYMSRARYFGGSCNLWAGRSMALSPLDFERRDWVPHSGWPIPYAEVARYYPAASRILDLPDLDDTSGREVPARISEHERRIFNGNVLAPTVSVWARKPKRFGAACKARFRAARNLRVLLNVSATRLITNEPGNAIDLIETSTLEGSRRTIRARQFVLACGGLENARLLLVSRDRHPDGIGNQHDLVGRFFMDHPRAVFGRIHVPAGCELPLLRGRPLRDGKLQLGIGLSSETQRRERLLNHYVTLEELTSGYAEASYQSVVQAMKVVLRRGHAGSRWDLARARLAEIPEMIYLLSPKELMPHPIYRAYAAMRDLAPRRRLPKTYVAVYFCEQPPSPDSRATLIPNTDRLGVPQMRLDWRIDDSVRTSALRLQELVAQQLRQTGIGQLEASDAELKFTDASHHMGTTRMGASPTQGVVDTDCRVHGMANLFVAGSSVFPCTGHANPTLTLVALSLRLARYLEASAPAQ
jgi:choline dehydrogenase-like flavoprotein